MASPRGTRKTTIRRRRRRLGQHFLEPAWTTRVIDALAPAADDRVLELGPGRGALTLPLGARVARLLAVELDAGLARALSARVPDTVEVIEGDMLALDLAMAAHRLRRGAAPDAALRVAGNLPYAVSAPILARLLREAQAAGFRDAGVMLQREVADRVVADPGSRDYGPLAILAALHADARRVLELPPGAFRPPPRVRSTLVTLTFREPVRAPDDPVRFERLVRRLFTQRRKQVANALPPAPPGIDRDPAAICRAAHLDPTRRPGSLAPEELLDLDAALAADQR